MEFSEESKLLIEHWDTFQDAMRAYERLRDKELFELVEDIAARVEDASWSEGWQLRDDHRARLRYFNPDWQIEESTVINVGTRRFEPDALFGSDDPPDLRVRVFIDYRELAERLLEEIESRDLLKYGEVQRNRAKVDIICEPLQKCPPESPEGYAEAVEEQVLRFLGHYMTALMDLDPVIQKELGKYRS
jgi:hypothetical protein